MNPGPDRALAWRPWAAALLLLLALAGPRLLLYRGVTVSHPLRFTDMVYHVANLDRLHKDRALPEQTRRDPYLRAFPAARQLFHAGHWGRAIYHLASLGLDRLGPSSLWTVQLINLPATLLLALGIFALGRRLGGVRLGWWACLYTLLSPALLAHSWYFSLDYPLIGMVLVGLVLLWRCRGFSRPGHSAALGLWSGLGLAVKATYPLYLLAPSLAALALGLTRPRSLEPPGAVEGPPRGAAPRLALALGAALGAALLGLALQGWHPEHLGQALDAHLTGPAWNPEDTQFTLVAPWTWRWLAALPLLAACNFPWPLLPLCLPGLVLLHRGSRAPRGRWLPLATLWGTYLLLTLLPNKMERYLQPLYPLLCLLAAWWVLRWLPRRWQAAALTLQGLAFAAVLGLAQVHPTPWPVDRRSATTDSYMLELEMPGLRRLAALRDNVHPHCQLPPLVQAMDQLVRHHTRPEPLAVAMQWPRGHGGPQAAPLAEQLDSRDLYLVATQSLRDRYLTFHDDANHAPLTRPLLSAPSLLLLHPADLNLGRRYPDLREAGSRPLDLRCGGPDEDPVQARLTVLHPR